MQYPLTAERPREINVRFDQCEVVDDDSTVLKGPYTFAALPLPYH